MNGEYFYPHDLLGLDFQTFCEVNADINWDILTHFPDDWLVYKLALGCMAIFLLFKGHAKEG